jgi:hypothetical protein
MTTRILVRVLVLSVIVAAGSHAAFAAKCSQLRPGDTKTPCMEISDLTQTLTEGGKGALKVHVGNIPRLGTTCSPIAAYPTKGPIALLDLAPKTTASGSSGDIDLVWRFRLWPKGPRMIFLEEGTWKMHVACSGIGYDDKQFQVQFCEPPVPESENHAAYGPVLIETVVGRVGDSADPSACSLAPAPSGTTIEAVQMTLKCKQKPHFVQFAMRDRDTEEGWVLPEEAWYGTPDPQSPDCATCFEFGRWHTDALRNWPSPYYDSYDSPKPGGNTRKGACTLVIQDAPTFGPTMFSDRDECVRCHGSANAPGCENSQYPYNVARAKFATFAICDGNVVAQAEWIRQDDKFRGKTFYRFQVKSPDQSLIDFFQDPSNLRDHKKFNSWPTD